jgi:DNA-binding NarL/FixJ family response regulator
MEVIRVLIADDHTLFRAGLHALLNLFSDIQVVGEASTGEDAIAKAEALQPDIILMDLQMPGVNNTPGVNGIEATRRITGSHPNIGIIVVTMFEDDSSVFSAMRAGARGYILKEAGEEEVLRAIRAVASGEAIFGPAIARRLVQFFSRPNPATDPLFPELTDREREILDLIARGESNTVIAQHLVLSPHTVRNHISSIFSKLQVADRAEAIIRAREAGLGQH